jgi:putative transposase
MTSGMKDASVLPFAQSSGTPDVLRTMLQQLVHEVIAAEFSAEIGAERYARSPDRRDVRNGYRTRSFTTRVGTLELKIPRDRSGEFQPSLFARYQRSEQALVAALAEMYIQGVSTRKVSAIVEQRCGERISASQVSAITAQLDGTLAAWRQRSLAGKQYPYLIVDAHVERVRREGQVRATAALWVIGVDRAGYREHLGLWLGASESGASWRAVFDDLIKRGLTGVTYVVSDEHAGLVQAIHRDFPEAAQQRCQVHFQRNARDKVSSPAVQQQVTDGLRAVWACGTRREADAQLARLMADLTPIAPRLATWLETAAPDTLAVYVLPQREARRRLATTNSIEHDHMAVRRRTAVVRVFPNEASFLRLASALAMERNDHWLGRRYFVPEMAHEVEVLMPAA